MHCAISLRCSVCVCVHGKMTIRTVVFCVCVCVSLLYMCVCVMCCCCCVWTRAVCGWTAWAHGTLFCSRRESHRCHAVFIGQQCRHGAANYSTVQRHMESVHARLCVCVCGRHGASPHRSAVHSQQCVCLWHCVYLSLCVCATVV